MDIPLNAKVKCADGTAGHTVCIIVNPVDEEVTHVVVNTGGLLGSEVIVPLEYVSRSTPEEIQLRCTCDELADMTPFKRSQYVSPGEEQHEDYLSIGLNPAFVGAYFWPYVAAAEEGAYVTVEQIPPDELGIHRGADVEASDGRIGHVDEFIVNPQNCHITHLVVREGHLWNKKAITVPVAAIKRIAGDVVYLKPDKATLQALPAVPR